MDVVPNIEFNKKLREPQIEAHLKIKGYFEKEKKGEALVVLPTGTGKSGLISIAPFGVCAGRVLVITPGLVTKQSVVKSLHPLDDNFWLNYDVIFDPEEIPIVEEYESDMLDSSLESCHFVIANVHKLYKNKSNSLLNRVPSDFFDMIIVDEAHHSVAKTWQDALNYFNDAKVLHVTGTPYRGDAKALPGEEIHNTSLSEAMQLQYIKWLRKITVNNTELIFTIPGDPKSYTIEEVLQLKDQEWVERSVALSKECSLDVIDESIKQLGELKELSPDVPHKILAVACNINHADDLAEWYESRNKSVIKVHSRMSPEELEDKFRKIDNHQCEVVVSVNMLMEGYDHKYLTVLSLFRPYRSLNAFAQVVGRVLRAIPENEITDFAIDNNAIVIYHEETGLNTIWKYFQDEVEKGKKRISRVYTFTEREYQERALLYADIKSDDYFIDSLDSFLPTIDFNELFTEARNNIEKSINEEIDKLRKSMGYNDDILEQIRKTLKKEYTFAKKEEFDDLLYSKRPELARKQIRKILYTNANDATQDILTEKGIDPKGHDLYNIFRKFIFNLSPKTTNDGIIVRYINLKVSRRFGSVKKREPEELRNSQKYMNEVINEIRRML